MEPCAEAGWECAEWLAVIHGAVADVIPFPSRGTVTFRSKNPIPNFPPLARKLEFTPLDLTQLI
jgi:hypothetical protein